MNPASDTARDPGALIADLVSARAHLERITAHLTGERLLGPYLAIVNPPLWELGHIAWFQEYWCLRRKPDGSVSASIMSSSDALYDSARVEHSTRWTAPLPDLAATRDYLAQVLGRVCARLEREPQNDTLGYFARLACYHEDMHAEAFRYTCQTLGYADLLAQPRRSAGELARADADVEMPGGRFSLGSQKSRSFVFDNEKWAHEVEVAPFKMARWAVTNARFLEFVLAGGYGRKNYWSAEGWNWVTGKALAAPQYWECRDGAWMQRRFDRVEPLQPDEPVVHVSLHEAMAWCAYAGRRLPTEAEWEYAAAWNGAAGGKREHPWGEAPPSLQLANLEGSGLAPVAEFAAGDSALGLRQLAGNVWEWTATPFLPYPGFSPDPYKEYSQPWFGTHQVLRGGSFATTLRLARNAFRNFYTPGRNDLFAGFRTCAL